MKKRDKTAESGQEGSGRIRTMHTENPANELVMDLARLQKQSQKQLDAALNQKTLQSYYINQLQKAPASNGESLR
jgi:hypothetical protein